MCRYAHKNYKDHYVCFDCRKTFKQPLLFDLLKSNGDEEVYKSAFYNPDSAKSTAFRKQNPKIVAYLEERYENRKYICPGCSKEMYIIGKDFKAPRKDKVKEWKIVEGMYKLGNTFQTCGCYGPGYIPHQKDDFIIYLEKVKAKYEKELNMRYISTPGELKQHLSYWGGRLEAVNEEIAKVRRW